MSYREKAGGFRNDVAIFRHVGTVYDLRHQLQGRVLEAVLDNDRLETAATVDMAELRALDV